MIAQLFAQKTRIFTKIVNLKISKQQLICFCTLFDLNHTILIAKNVLQTQ